MIVKALHWELGEQKNENSSQGNTIGRLTFQMVINNL